MEESREKSVCLCDTPEATLWAEIDGKHIVTCRHCGIRRSVEIDAVEGYVLINDSQLAEKLLLEVDLRDYGVQRRKVSCITIPALHLMSNPTGVLEVVHGLLKRDGVLTIEWPLDMATDTQAMTADVLRPGRVLWHFTLDQLKWVLGNMHFTVISEFGIAGVMRIIALPSLETALVTVFGPPGIGDILWTFNKLRAIREREAPCRLHYVVCTATGAKSHDRAKELLSMCDLIDSHEFRDLPLPSDVGNTNPAVPVYNLIANSYLEPNSPGKSGGARIEDWRPELPTDHNIELVVPEIAKLHASALVRQDRWNRKFTVIYFSSGGWNDACTAQQAWFPSDWAAFCLRLHDAGVTPVILGSQWDRDYFSAVHRKLVSMGQNPDDIWVDLLGKTTLPVAMEIMHKAAVTVGICAGLPMLAAYLGWPTIMLWPKAGVLRRPIPMAFSPEFQTNWIPEKVLTSGSYSNLSFGEFDEDQLLKLTLFKAGAVQANASAAAG